MICLENRRYSCADFPFGIFSFRIPEPSCGVVFAVVSSCSFLARPWPVPIVPSSAAAWVMLKSKQESVTSDGQVLLHH